MASGIRRIRLRRGGEERRRDGEVQRVDLKGRGKGRGRVSPWEDGEK
jgi:hypothetical protein